MKTVNIKNPPLVVAMMILAITIPVAIALMPINTPLPAADLSNNPSPLGYTWSLGLWIIPMLFMYGWMLRHPDIAIPKAAFHYSMMILIPMGFVLDILFGTYFFKFLNHDAVLGITIPGVGGDLPIEEFIFYISGFITVLLLYIWCDEYWLQAYNAPDYAEQAKSERLEKLLIFHPESLAVGLFLLIMAIFYKNTFSESPGFPGYFAYIIAVAFIPSMGFFKATRNYINWRAFSFTFFVITLISLLWEASLALPYQWWSYNDPAMMGIFINGWHRLPLEAVLVWLAVTFTTVIIFEAVKIKKSANVKLY
ncbi:MAG: hypothetical protein R8L53_09565 [Mariprofundales bacterium]